MLAFAIHIPWLPPEKQTVEDGRKQIGRIMGKLLGDKSELNFDDYRVTRTEQWGQSPAGNNVKMATYRFSAVTGV